MNASTATACPICHSPPGLSFDTRYTRAGKCSNPECGHLFALRPALNQGVHEHDVAVADFFRRRNERLVGRLIRQGLIRPRARVLDIGAGLGHIVQEIRRQEPSAEALCVEASPESIRHLRANGLAVVERPDELRAQIHGRFDLILLVEVIEHVEDPVSLLRLCRSLLADQGAVFITTPSGELRSGAHGTAAYDIPEHIQFFTRRSLEKALRAAGFTRSELVEMREYHAGSRIALIKWLKDTARQMRNVLQGKHHFICIAKAEK